MNMQRCNSGHYYDASKYNKCPYCHPIDSTTIRPHEYKIDNDLGIDFEFLKSHEPFWGEWLLGDEIGRGSSGRVFIINSNINPMDSCALKVIRIPISRGTQDNAIINIPIVKRLLTICELSKKFNNTEHIVRTFDYSFNRMNEHSIVFFIRMELLTPLNKCLSQLNLKEIVKIGVDVCNALDELRKEHVVHRDIKIENLFASDKQQYKLGDFECSVIVPESGVFLDDFLHGTKGYLAPEVKYCHEYSFSSDIYSLGILLGKLLSFLTGSQDIWFTDINSEMANLSFVSVIKKASSFCVEDRYHAIKDMRLDLIRCLEEISDPNAVVPSVNSPTQSLPSDWHPDFSFSFSNAMTASIRERTLSPFAEECLPLIAEGSLSPSDNIEHVPWPSDHNQQSKPTGKIFKVVIKCLEWFLFTCLLALLPVIITLLIEGLTNTIPFPVAYETEILFFSISISIITLRNRKKFSAQVYFDQTLETLVTFISILIIIVSSVYYGIVVINNFTLQLKNLNHMQIFNTGVVIAIGAAFIGLCRQILEVE